MLMVHERMSCGICLACEEDWPCTTTKLAAAEAQRNALAAENARLREGLAFYADESNYDDSVQTVSPEMPGLGPIHYYAPSIAEDRGERARALLTQEESGDVLNR
jgi:hypothetical protein